MAAPARGARRGAGTPAAGGAGACGLKESRRPAGGSNVEGG